MIVFIVNILMSMMGFGIMLCPLYKKSKITTWVLLFACTSIWVFGTMAFFGDPLTPSSHVLWAGSNLIN